MSNLIFKKLVNDKDFKSLQIGDGLLVDWGKTWDSYKIHSIKDGEIILDKKRNTYFNIEMYLKNDSFAQEVWLIYRE